MQQQLISMSMRTRTSPLGQLAEDKFLSSLDVLDLVAFRRTTQMLDEIAV